MEASKPRRGAPPKGEARARERILTTADELFYRECIHATGVDTVVERSGVSKTSLYRVFRSKDELIAAFATEQDRSFWAWWDRIEERHAEDPRTQLEALLSGIAKRVRGTSDAAALVCGVAEAVGVAGLEFGEAVQAFGGGVGDADGHGGDDLVFPAGYGAREGSAARGCPRSARTSRRR